MRKHIAVILAGLTLASAGSAYAQLGNGGGTYADVEHGEISAGQFIEHFVSNAKQVLAAESGLLSTFELETDAATARSASQQLDAPLTRSVLEDVLQRQADAAKALQSRLGAGQPLQGDARARFPQEVRDLARSLTASSALAADLNANRKKLSAARGAEATQAVYLSKALPDHVRNIHQAVEAAVAYGRAQNIPVSTDMD